MDESLRTEIQELLDSARREVARLDDKLAAIGNQLGTESQLQQARLVARTQRDTLLEVLNLR